MSSQPLRLRKWGNPLPLVAGLFFLMYIPGHVTSLPLACEKFSGLQILTLTARFHVPHSLFPVCTTASRLPEYMVSSPASSPCRCSSLGSCVFLPPSLSAFWSHAGSQWLLPSLLPQSCVYISIRAHVMVCFGWQMAGFIYLPPLLHSPAWRRKLCHTPFHIPQPVTPYGIQSSFSTHIWREFQR